MRGARSIRVAGIATPALSFADSVLLFRMPAGMSPGPAIVEITAAGEPLAAIVTMVDLAPPVIGGTSLGAAARPAAAGDLITMLVTGLVEGADTVDVQRLQVLVGGAAAKVVQTGLAISAATGAVLGHDIQFELDPKQIPGTFPLIILIDGRPSAPFNIVVR